MTDKHYGECAVRGTTKIINEIAGKEAGTRFKYKAKKFLGIRDLGGMSEEEQIKKMNAFWRETLEPIPETTFIRSWLENSGNLDEYLDLFESEWAKDVIAVGALDKKGK